MLSIVKRTKKEQSIESNDQSEQSIECIDQSEAGYAVSVPSSASAESCRNQTLRLGA